jgi:putative ABC transport system permease protein
MILGDTIRLAFRNLRQSKLRTAITTLGVSIGIASLAGMVSLGVGLQDQFTSRLTKSGVFDSITVTPGAIGGGGLFGRGGRGRGAQTGARLGGQAPESLPMPSPRKPLNDEAIAELAKIPHVKDAFPALRSFVEVKFAGNSERMFASGIPMSAKGEGNFQKIPYGTFFPNDTDNTCLITLDMAKQINSADPGSLVGQTLTLAFATQGIGAFGAPMALPATEEKYTVVGVVERDPNGAIVGGLGISGLMIPLGNAKRFNRLPYQSLTVKVTASQFTTDVEDEIKKQGYGAFSINDALEGAKRAFIILDIVLALIGSIALAVSSLGIVNTMVMSILERTREICVMKAIGGSDGDIRRIFLVEASAIGFMGGLGGVALGWLVGRVINFGANVYIRNQGGDPGNLFSLPLWLVAGALGFSVLVSLLAGSYPAGRAAKLNPMQALRHD